MAVRSTEEAARRRLRTLEKYGVFGMVLLMAVVLTLLQRTSSFRPRT